MQFLSVSSVVLVFSIFIAGCGQDGIRFLAEDNQVDSIPPDDQPNGSNNNNNNNNGGPTNPPAPTCVPAPAPKPGLRAELALPEDGLNWNSLQAYWHFSPEKNSFHRRLSASNSYVFPNLHIPNRRSFRGMPAGENEVVRDPITDEMLEEFFSLRFRGVFVAPKTGIYEFAIISDDGVMMRAKPHYSRSFQTVISADGTFPERLNCANHLNGKRFFKLMKDQQLPIEILYLQSLPIHISLTLLMRRVDEHYSHDYIRPSLTDILQVDPLCGRGGGDFFHDSRVNPSAPTANYQSLLRRGWQPVPSEMLYQTRKLRCAKKQHRDSFIFDERGDHQDDLP